MKTKTNKTDLEKKKSLFFQFGMILALGITLSAFEYGTTELPNIDEMMRTPDPVEIIEMMPNTKIEEIKQPPAPPQVNTADVIVIHKDNALINDNPDIFDEIEAKDLPLLITQHKEVEVEDEVDYNAIEFKPKFMGGNANDFAKYIASKLVYPPAAAENGVQGRVILRFTIDKTGKIVNIKTLRAEDPLLEAEAVRLVSTAPDWQPGYLGGKPTNVTFTFPITFRLQ